MAPTIPPILAQSNSAVSTSDERVFRLQSIQLDLEALGRKINEGMKAAHIATHEPMTADWNVGAKATFQVGSLYPVVGLDVGKKTLTPDDTQGGDAPNGSISTPSNQFTTTDVYMGLRDPGQGGYGFSVAPYTDYTLSLRHVSRTSVSHDHGKIEEDANGSTFGIAVSTERPLVGYAKLFDGGSAFSAALLVNLPVYFGEQGATFWFGGDSVCNNEARDAVKGCPIGSYLPASIHPQVKVSIAYQPYGLAAPYAPESVEASSLALVQNPISYLAALSSNTSFGVNGVTLMADEAFIFKTSQDSYYQGHLLMGVGSALSGISHGDRIGAISQVVVHGNQMQQVILGVEQAAALGLGIYGAVAVDGYPPTLAAIQAGDAGVLSDTFTRGLRSNLYTEPFILGVGLADALRMRAEDGKDPRTLGEDGGRLFAGAALVWLSAPLAGNGFPKGGPLSWTPFSDGGEALEPGAFLVDDDFIGDKERQSAVGAMGFALGWDAAKHGAVTLFKGKTASSTPSDTASNGPELTFDLDYKTKPYDRNPKLTEQIGFVTVGVKNF